MGIVRDLFRQLINNRVIYAVLVRPIIGYNVKVDLGLCLCIDM
jgi:hypothetical protein